MIGLMLDKFFTLLYRHDNQGHIVVFQEETTLIKAGHTPLVAYRLLEGSVDVYDKNKSIGQFGPHTCWGMNEIMNEVPSRFTVRIKKGSKVCTIGKSEMHKTWMKVLHLFEVDMLEKISEQAPT